jgi:HK97 family phage portal protein
VDRSTSWGTGIEQQMQGFLNFTMSYWFKLWEQDVQRDLIPQEDSNRYFTEFLLEGLLRADTAARGEFYSKMFGIGAFSPNDILEKENMNGYQGGDEHFMPLNMMPVGQQKPTE